MAWKPVGPKGRQHPLTILIAIACIALLAGTVSPAFGGPTAPAAVAKGLKTAKRALGIAKQADKRSKLALAAAQKTGPAGPRGQRGSEGLDGAEGPRGPAGAKGATGPQGATGAQGEAGPQGATGPQGETGPKGETGATGPAAHTASRSVSRGTSQSIATEETVIDLASTHDGGADAQLTIPYSARIMAFASIQVRNPDAVAREASCVLRISDGTGPDSGLSSISQTYTFDFPAQDGYDVSTALQGAASKPAGTYNVQLACEAAAGEPLTAIRANLSVLASDD